MAKPTPSALRWPALDLGGRKLPSHLAYEKGVWGKVHGAPSDFRWIAATREFSGESRHLERDLPLGTEDEPVSAALWLALDDTCYAVALYPSRAHDAAGRSGFIEKQILEWKRSPDVPVALSALLLLSVAAKEEEDAREQRTDIRWSDDDVIELDRAVPIAISLDAIEAAAEEGLASLTEATTEETLADLYAALLAGGRAVSLKGLAAPLPPTALAALLLPLPRTLADKISIAGWLPSSRLSDSGVDDVRRTWDLVLGGTTAVPSDAVTPTADDIDEARAMAKAVFRRMASARVETSVIEEEPWPPEEPAKAIQLTLWGPTAAGKTVILAKLYLEADDDEASGEWDVFPTESSVKFIKEMRARMRSNNVFPPATVVITEEIEYLFRHRRTGVVASLQLEDRPGSESIDLESAESTAAKVPLKKRLGSADGLVLLFDPLSDPPTLESRFWNMLEILHVASGRKARKDDRPTAVCVSKADTLIATPDDFRRAIEAPDEFVRERVPPFLTDALDRFCSNYRVFPVSGAGIRLLHGAIEPAVFFDENLERRICPGGRAFNLMAPFTWLLSELTSTS